MLFILAVVPMNTEPEVPELAERPDNVAVRETLSKVSEVSETSAADENELNDARHRSHCGCQSTIYYFAYILTNTCVQSESVK